MILNAGVVQEKEIMEILKEPEKYIESQKYFSWERFFTNLLIEKTDGTYMKYQKSKLNPVYLHEKNKRMILSSVRESYEKIVQMKQIWRKPPFYGRLRSVEKVRFRDV